MHHPTYTFREGEDPAAYQTFNEDASGVIHEACARTPQEREFPLYPDDIEELRSLEPTLCERCEGEIAPPLEKKTPHALWLEAGRDAARYRELMIRYGHLVQREKPPEPHAFEALTRSCACSVCGGRFDAPWHASEKERKLIEAIKGMTNEEVLALVAEAPGQLGEVAKRGWGKCRGCPFVARGSTLEEILESLGLHVFEQHEEWFIAANEKAKATKDPA